MLLVGRVVCSLVDRAQGYGTFDEETVTVITSVIEYLNLDGDDEFEKVSFGWPPRMLLEEGSNSLGMKDNARWRKGCSNHGNPYWEQPALTVNDVSYDTFAHPAPIQSYKEIVSQIQCTSEEEEGGAGGFEMVKDAPQFSHQSLSESLLVESKVCSSSLGDEFEEKASSSSNNEIVEPNQIFNHDLDIKDSMVTTRVVADHPPPSTIKECPAVVEEKDDKSKYDPLTVIPSKKPVRPKALKGKQHQKLRRREKVWLPLWVATPLKWALLDEEFLFSKEGAGDLVVHLTKSNSKSSIAVRSNRSVSVEELKGYKTFFMTDQGKVSTVEGRGTFDLDTVAYIIYSNDGVVNFKGNTPLWKYLEGHPEGPVNIWLFKGIHALVKISKNPLCL